MSNDPFIGPRHLPSFLSINEVIEANNELVDAESKNSLAKLADFNLSALEKITITRALNHSGGNRTAAAELLGISRRTLQRKLKDLKQT
jgi:DNA-binding NtrC family response regulator